MMSETAAEIIEAVKNMTEQDAAILAAFITEIQAGKQEKAPEAQPPGPRGRS